MVTLKGILVLPSSLFDLHTDGLGSYVGLYSGVI
jgi:hypothetical protein